MNSSHNPRSRRSSIERQGELFRHQNAIAQTSNETEWGHTSQSTSKTKIYPTSSNNSSNPSQKLRDNSIVSYHQTGYKNSIPQSEIFPARFENISEGTAISPEVSSSKNSQPINGNLTVQVTCNCDSKIIKFGRKFARKIQEIRKVPETTKDQISDHDKLLSHAKVLEMLPELSNLTKIYLSDMNLTDLPIEFQELTQVEFLALDLNKLRIIPEAVCRLPRLTTLYLHNNKISDISRNVEEMRSLKFLGLQFNRIKKLPPHLFRISNLRYLNLSDNLIDEIPNTVSNLVNLKGLWLGNNEIESLPLCIYNLKKLQILHVEGNKIQHVPKFLYEMNLSELVVREEPVDRVEAIKRSRDSRRKSRFGERGSVKTKRDTSLKR